MIVHFLMLKDHHNEKLFRQSVICFFHSNLPFANRRIAGYDGKYFLLILMNSQLFLAIGSLERARLEINRKFVQVQSSIICHFNKQDISTGPITICSL